jgi:hypothetical protein
MNAETFLRLLHIDEELIQISHWLAENRNKEIASRLNPLIDDLTRLIGEMKAETSDWLKTE